MKRKEIIGVWRNVHNEEFCNLLPLRKVLKITRSVTVIRVEHGAGVKRIEIRRNGR